MNSTDQTPEPFAQDDATFNTLDSPSTDQRLSVIGIGSSAGGLRPLQTFFTSLPADTGMYFVVVTHLSLEHESMQIDSFFRSLGEHHGDGAAIILSGTGSDGAVGMQTIKENGGLLLVQDPKEAEYDGMPRSAIATGLVDVVAPVAELAAKLVEAKRTQASLKLPQETEKRSETAQNTLTQILTQLRTRMGHDFSGYPTTGSTTPSR